MSPTKRGCMTTAALAALLAGSQIFAATAVADPETTEPPPTPAVEPAAAANPEVLHNIVYRARVDGVSRGATITYAAEGDQLQTANPTMVPGHTFEANAVLPASQRANMRVSIEWPYSANLRCEILVDDAVVAQAEDFIAPRITPNREDPDYGALTCEAPVSGLVNTIPADPAATPPLDGAPHGEPAPPVDTAPPPA